ncbi:hypothetical protein BH10PSE13_BH10PSE13_09040 [soil metagenome]
MSEKRRTIDPPPQTPVEKDRAPLEDLSCMPNDADDRSDDDRPTTDHDARGWRAIDPVKP